MVVAPKFLDLKNFLNLKFFFGKIHVKIYTGIPGIIKDLLRKDF